MKSSKIFWLSTLAIITFFVSGCVNSNKTDSQEGFPEIGIPAKNLNQHLKITTPIVIPSFQKENRIDLLVENLSQSAIVVEPGVDVKIFKKSATSWEPVANNIDYNNSKWSVPVKGGDMPGIRVIDIYPNLNVFSDPIILRVVIIGKPENLPGVMNTVSYVDITVSPSVTS